MNQTSPIYKLLNYLNLEGEIDDYEKIHQSIEKDVIFKGTNLWILVFAIFIASVGLNMNSTAVIIGAMLISPLMGPINGMGYSLATYNFPLFRKSVKNFTFAVIASLVTSTTYFTISPISTAHSELLARTSPSIYDVLIAFFGGLAGIVAISSRQKGNVIPGVAIATALMPPLCTSGYGLATGQFYYFFGAIYLFTINTVFIAISSVVTSQILKFPIITIVDQVQKKRVNRWISVIIFLVLIPSIYFGYNLVQREKFLDNAGRYLLNVQIFEGNYLLKSDVDFETKSIKLTYGGASLSETQKNNIAEKAKDFDLEDVNVEFRQGFSFDEITQKTTEVDQLKLELSRVTELLNEKNRLLDSISHRKQMARDLFNEIITLFPQIASASYSNSYVYDKINNDPQKVAIIILTTKNRKISSGEKEKIEGWLKTRLKDDKIKVLYE